MVHYGYIEKFIEDLGTRFNIREIAFDRWGAVQMSQTLRMLVSRWCRLGKASKTCPHHPRN